MRTSKKKRLRSAGWRVGTATEFLGLSREEALLVEIKLLLADDVRGRRVDLGLTQVELARRLASSQSRVAKMEAGDATVSIDLLVHALLVLGATRKEIARVLARAA